MSHPYLSIQVANALASEGFPVAGGHRAGRPSDPSDRPARGSHSYNIRVMDTFTAVADPVRRRLIEALAAKQRPVKELVELFPISQPAVSRHLRLLREVGIVESVQPSGEDARLRLYRLRPEAFSEIQEWLQIFWQSKLDAFAAHARERS